MSIAGGLLSQFDAKHFVQTCQRALPRAVLSLGWTTGYPKTKLDLEGYSAAMIEEMLTLCDEIVAEGTHVTFPLHLLYAHRSWIQVEQLLLYGREDGRKQLTTSITLWGDSDKAIRAKVEATTHYAEARIFMDLVETAITSKH